MSILTITQNITSSPLAILVFGLMPPCSPKVWELGIPAKFWKETVNQSIRWLLRKIQQILLLKIVRLAAGYTFATKLISCRKWRRRKWPSVAPRGLVCWNKTWFGCYKTFRMLKSVANISLRRICLKKLNDWWSNIIYVNYILFNF